MIGISSEKWSVTWGGSYKSETPISTSSSRGSFRAKVPISPRKAYMPLESAQTIVLLLTVALSVSLLVCVFHVGLSLTTVMRQTATHMAWIYLRWCLLLSDHGKSPFCTTIWENIIFCFSKHPTSKSKIYSKAEAETFYTKTSVIPTWKHQKQLSNEKKHGCLGYIGDYTTQFIWGLFHETMT